MAVGFFYDRKENLKEVLNLLVNGLSEIQASRIKKLLNFQDVFSLDDAANTRLRQEVIHC